MSAVPFYYMFSHSMELELERRERRRRHLEEENLLPLVDQLTIFLGSLADKIEVIFVTDEMFIEGSHLKEKESSGFEVCYGQEI